MSGRQLEDEDAERIGYLKETISDALAKAGVVAYPNELENDILVDGALTDIVRVYLEYRSEIDEELG